MIARCPPPTFYFHNYDGSRGCYIAAYIDSWGNGAGYWYLASGNRLVLHTAAGDFVIRWRR